jgi:hypothetical protein
MTKRARTERREAERAAEKLARQREKLAAMAPGGSPDLPIDVTTAAVIEPQARSAACPRCGVEGAARVLEHEAKTVLLDGGERRLRVVKVGCTRCGASRPVYFRIVEPS